MRLVYRFLARLEDRKRVGDFLAKRDEQAFHGLYHLHTPHLYRLALRLVRWVESDAEEVVQESWIRAIEGLAGFHGESSLRTWLSGIVVNRCRELGRERRGQRLEASSAALDAAAFASTPDQPESMDLERAIAALPDGYREVLVLHDIEGYTHAEIGACLEIETGTSKSQLCHARKALRDALRSTGSSIEARRQAK